MKEKAEKIIAGSAAHGWVVEPLARAVLEEYGLPVSKSEWAKTAEAAVTAAGRIGYPLVVKVVSPKVVHKSDVGGVVVGLRDADSVRSAFDRMARIEGFDGVLVDRMVSGVEMIVGAKQDAQFGTVVLAGLGGTAVELYRDVFIRMAPISAAAARDALLSLKAAPLLTGHRGAASADLDSLCGLLSRFSEMAHELGAAVDSIDLNPVMCGPDSAVIADARMVLPLMKQ